MRGGSVPAPATPKVKIKVLYLFSGEPREDDLTMALVRIGDGRGLDVEVTEIDISQGAHQDLSLPAAWKMIMDQIASKEYAIVFMSPPCSTFSRSLYNALVAGPLPLRSHMHPKGFPWMSGVRHEKIKTHN